jgi:hypothetical protein
MPKNVGFFDSKHSIPKIVTLVFKSRQKYVVFWTVQLNNGNLAEKFATYFTWTS